MGQRLAGKRAIITAAGQGIGRASALAMATEGAEVFASDINAEALDALKGDATGTIHIREMDVRNESDILAEVARAQPDILFNCAGFVHHGSVMDATDEEWDFAFDLNARSMFHTIRAVLPGMLERESGSIINMSSAVSSLAGLPNRFIYSASKAAVIGMTKSVAADYISHGIRCNCICPATVESPSWHERVKALGEQLGSYEKAMEQFIARQPMGRVAKAEEIAALVVYLASDESGYTTGQAHLIDGGMTM